MSGRNETFFGHAISEYIILGQLAEKIYYYLDVPLDFYVLW